MKKLLPLLMIFLCCHPTLSIAATPEDGVYLILPEYASNEMLDGYIPEHLKQFFILSHMTWDHLTSPALLVVAGGYPVHAHGTLLLTFSKDPTALSYKCPQVYFELEKAVIRQQSDGEGSTLSFNVSEDESAPLAISAGSALAMYGVLEFTSAEEGLFTVTSSMPLLTDQLQPVSCTTTDRMYVVKL